MDFTKNMGNMKKIFMKKRFWAVLCTITFAIVMIFNLSGCTSNGDTEEATEIPSEQIAIEEGSGNDSNMTPVEFPEDSDTDKMVSVSVENLGRANPFLPPGEMVVSVPQERLKYDVVSPSESPNADPDARKVATTQVSGIMYDKISPSALLKVEGLDYLVRAGDVINGYKVLSIDKSLVTVQVGANIYKVGVGEIVEDSQNKVNYNQIANLSKKFGGNR